MLTVVRGGQTAFVVPGRAECPVEERTTLDVRNRADEWVDIGRGRAFAAALVRMLTRWSRRGD
jgi:hypothetical protein